SPSPASTVYLVHRRSPTPETAPLSLHDALPISLVRLLGKTAQLVLLVGQQAPHDLRAEAHGELAVGAVVPGNEQVAGARMDAGQDRKSTRLNSSHAKSSYAVFCLKKTSSRRQAR